MHAHNIVHCMPDDAREEQNMASRQEVLVGVLGLSKATNSKAMNSSLSSTQTHAHTHTHTNTHKHTHTHTHTHTNTCHTHTHTLTHAHMHVHGASTPVVGLHGSVLPVIALGNLESVANWWPIPVAHTMSYVD